MEWKKQGMETGGMRMWVTILATEYEKYPEYYGTTLWLPATRAALQDAMEQVRVPEGGSYCLTRLDGWPKFLAERLLDNCDGI